MTLRRQSLLIAFGAALLFSALSLVKVLEPWDDRIYDFFLRWRPERERFNNILFLDVDDLAISHIGVFPWPRSVMADGMLRLKEYNARMAVLDIEYVETSPPGVDTIFLERRLPGEFNRSFEGISSNVAELLDALAQGRIGEEEEALYSQELLALIDEERSRLYEQAEGVAQDNDLYLAQASRLFGATWGTLNLQREFPLDDERAERRFFAEEHFAYPLTASQDAPRGGDVDALPPIPSFMESLKGAGFTNVTIDEDGVRRRIYLAREVRDHWYLQLAFAPLMEILGNPEIILEKRRLTLKNAKLPGSDSAEDILIPLDAQGAMYLDWPITPFLESYSHLSFAVLSYLDEYETALEDYLAALAASDLWLFPDDSGLLFQHIGTINGILGALDTARTYRSAALEENSEEAFAQYVDLKNQALSDLEALLASNPQEGLGVILESLAERFPDDASLILDEGDYVLTLMEYAGTMRQMIEELRLELRDKLDGRICIIGRVDTGTTDIGVNPFHPEYVNVGTHGVVLDTIISQSFITRLDSTWSAALTFLLIPLVILPLTGRKPNLRTILGLGIAIFVLLSSFLLFYLRGVFFGPLGLAMGLVAAVILREVVAYAGSEQEKQFIRKAFSTYLSEDVVKEILEDPEKLQLGGSKRHMSAIFTDVQGFSSISEKLDPEDLVRLLNNYLSAMSDILLEQGGTIDKYEGDAIIAFFGAPLDIQDHALRACISAIYMKKIEETLNREYQENRLSPSPLLTRIGINTGEMVVGNMGADKKMDYTIMGNAVNLASRLEGVNKQYGTWILTTGETLRETNDRILARRLDRVRVVGINEPVQLYELLDIAEEAGDAKKRLADLFHAALDSYEKRDWIGAEAAFLRILDLFPQDNPSRIFLKRCAEYRETPPARDWDGIINFTEK